MGEAGCEPGKRRRLGIFQRRSLERAFDRGRRPQMDVARAVRRAAAHVQGAASSSVKEAGMVSTLPGVVPGNVMRECAEEAYPAKVVSGSPRTPGILTSKSDPESGALLSMSSVSRTRALVT
jgi:hypothetical protein